MDREESEVGWRGGCVSEEKRKLYKFNISGQSSESSTDIHEK